VDQQETGMAIPAQLITLEKFLRLPEEEPALEFVDGVVAQKLSPKTRHSRLQTYLAERINRVVEPRRLALAFTELRTTFAGASFVPDVAVFVWDRLPIDADGEFIDDVFTPPDIAVEILSPGQRVARVAERCHWYVENGVRIGVLINPRDRTVTIFRTGVPPRMLSGDDAIDLSDILPGFELTARELFAALSIR
jgi:Uma2 family endonuclease